MNRFNYNRPDTRARVAARRRQNRAARSGSTVRPGPRRVAGAWLATGRIASLLLLIASIGGLLYIFTAPQFTVQDVRVEGAQVMNTADIVNLAAARSQSIWFVDTRQIVQRLQDNPYIEHASVSVALPDRLTITIAERRPEVRWQAGGTRYLVDLSGRVLGVDGTAPLSDTLVIEDRSNRTLKPNDHVDPDALKLGRALALRLPRELNLQPRSIAWEAAKGIVVTTPDGRTVVFGQMENIDDKLAVLGVLLQDGTPFTYLDLRPGTPYYRNDGGGDRP